MYKYIVTWCIQISCNCPQQSSTDSYGRISQMQTLAICFTSDCGHKKEFDTKSGAIAFYKDAKLQSGQFGYNELTNIKLDSIKK